MTSLHQANAHEAWQPQIPCYTAHKQTWHLKECAVSYLDLELYTYITLAVQDWIEWNKINGTYLAPVPFNEADKSKSMLILLETDACRDAQRER